MNWDTFFRSNITPLIPYKAGLREDEVRDLVDADTLYKLSSNENPYPPFPHVIEAMTEVLMDLNSYCDGSAQSVKDALSERYHIPTEQITVGNGSNELLDLIGECCLNPGDEVVFGWPSFMVYQSLAQINGATPIAVPLTGDARFDLQAMLAAITPQTKLVIVCNPNNPTGTVVTAEEFASFIAALPEHVLLVIDEAYIEYVTPGDTFDSFSYYDGTRPIIILRTFSKIYSLAGIRCGYGFAPTPVIEAIDKVREPFNVNSVAQAAACACLQDGTEVIARRDENNANKELLYACFEALGIEYFRSSANFIWVVVDNPGEVFGKLLSYGIIVRDLGNGTALRIGVGTLAATEATIAAFNTIFGGTE
ncbi:MAG: histidinol-phosphate transaminase [Actinobacteria bacterium]|nr:histidinol-phosphate transaminase [Actinomycetota bacterium]